MATRNDVIRAAQHWATMREQGTHVDAAMALAAFDRALGSALAAAEARGVEKERARCTAIVERLLADVDFDSSAYMGGCGDALVEVRRAITTSPATGATGRARTSNVVTRPETGWTVETVPADGAEFVYRSDTYAPGQWLGVKRVLTRETALPWFREAGVVEYRVLPATEGRDG